MLSRTADHLFWMARYTERAENTARMLDVNLQTALLPQSESSVELLWRGMLGISELQSQYDARYGNLTPWPSGACSMPRARIITWTFTTGQRCCARCRPSRSIARSTAM